MKLLASFPAVLLLLLFRVLKDGDVSISTALATSCTCMCNAVEYLVNEDNDLFAVAFGTKEGLRFDWRI